MTGPAGRRLFDALVALGALLRAAQYLANRSLWLDESRLSLNILSRSIPELLQPLDYDQGAPIGYLVLARLAVEALGGSEYVLRLLPFLGSLAALLLFRSLVQRLLVGAAATLALALFAISEPLVYYASEAKQYSTDVAVAVLLWALAQRLLGRELGRGGGAALALTGALALWLSHPAAFVLAAIVAARMVARGAGSRQLRELLPVVGVWGLSFLAHYAVSLRQLSQSQFLLDYWNDAFMPLPPRSFQDLTWFLDAPVAVFQNPGGFAAYLVGLAALLFLLGCVSLARRSPSALAMLAGPALLALAASGLHKYPFRGRLLLFIVPALLILIAEGFALVRASTRARVLPALTLVVLLANPTLLALYHLARPRTREEIRPVMRYLMDRRRPDERIYVFAGSRDAFRYYLDRFGLGRQQYTVGAYCSHDLNRCVDELTRLKGRWWFVFSHAGKEAVLDEEKFYAFWLGRLGRQLDGVQQRGASAYLFELGGPP